MSDVNEMSVHIRSIYIISIISITASPSSAAAYIEKNSSFKSGRKHAYTILRTDISTGLVDSKFLDRDGWEA